MEKERETVKKINEKKKEKEEENYAIGGRAAEWVDELSELYSLTAVKTHYTLSLLIICSF